MRAEATYVERMARLSEGHSERLAALARATTALRRHFDLVEERMRESEARRRTGVRR
jgi:hypothetical protein